MRSRRRATGSCAGPASTSTSAARRSSRARQRDSRRRAIRGAAARASSSAEEEGWGADGGLSKKPLRRRSYAPIRTSARPLNPPDASGSTPGLRSSASGLEGPADRVGDRKCARGNNSRGGGYRQAARDEFFQQNPQIAGTREAAPQELGSTLPLRTARRSRSAATRRLCRPCSRASVMRTRRAVSERDSSSACPTSRPTSMRAPSA